MLPKLVVLICSAYVVRSDDASNPVFLNPFPTQPGTQHLETNYNNEDTDSEVVVTSKSESLLSTNCPANNILLQIQKILARLLNEGDEVSNESIDLNKIGMQQVNDVITNDEQPTIHNEIGNEDLIYPLSKNKLLRQLLKNSDLNGKLKTKIAVEYEIPDEDVNYKDALTKIHQIIKNANLNDKYTTANMIAIKNDRNHDVLPVTLSQKTNGLHTLINAKKLPSIPKSFLEPKQNFNNILKYLSTKKENIDSFLPTLKSYKTFEEINAVKDKSNATLDLITEFAKMINRPSPVNVIEPDKDIYINDVKTKSDIVHKLPQNFLNIKKPYRTHMMDKNARSIHVPSKYNDQNQNFTNIFPDEPKKYKNFEPFQNYVNQLQDADEISNKVLITSNGKFVSTYPTYNQILEKTEKNLFNKYIAPSEIDANKILKSYTTDLLSQQNSSRSLDDRYTYLQGNYKNGPRNNSVNILSMLNSEDDKPNQWHYLQQSKFQYKPPPHHQVAVTPNFKYPDLQSNIINPNLVAINQIPYPINYDGSDSSKYQFPRQNSQYTKFYASNISPHSQASANFGLLNQISKQANILTNPVHQATYVNTNPYFVDSKLVNYGDHVNPQLLTDNNFANLQRIVGETSNVVKLKSSPDNSETVELTYMVQQPNPFIYQPVYFVKYRLPYDSFIQKLRDSQQRTPNLKSNPAKLHQELLSISEVSEVSPNLKGVGHQELLSLITNNGALVNTKIFTVNETLLDKQLRTVQNINSILAPKEIVNVTHTIHDIKGAGKKFDYSEKHILQGHSIETKSDHVVNFDKIGELNSSLYQRENNAYKKYPELFLQAAPSLPSTRLSENITSTNANAPQNMRYPDNVKFFGLGK